MKISKLEYIKMQISIYSGMKARIPEAGHADFCKKCVDETLELNGVTFADEPEVKPVTDLILARVEILKLKADHYLWHAHTPDDVKSALEKSLFAIDEELKKRGLVIA